MSKKKFVSPFHALPYVKPVLGRDYWIKDGMLPDPMAVARRCREKMEWELGQPWSNETWPGMRSPDGLLPDELALVEDWVRKQTGSRRLWQVDSPEDGTLSHNHVQVVGGSDSGPRPHTDSRRLCKYAAILYLSPSPVPHAGTSFYRLRLPDRRVGGNVCPAPYANLREALNVRGLPPQAWLVHSATSYFGESLEDKRTTIVFFWMAD